MFLITKQIVTDVAKTMRREAAARGIAVVGHSRSLDGTARALGFRDFNGLSAAIEVAPLRLQVEGDDSGGIPLFRMMSSHSADWSFRVIGAPSASDTTKPGFRTAREMTAAWLGAGAQAGQVAATSTSLALVLVGSLIRSWKPDAVAPDGIPTSPALFVPATIRTDDGLREADFDAAGYFEQASDEELWELHSIGFRGDYQADAVAWHVQGEPGFEDVTALLEYDQEVARCGFEVVVEAEAAMAWIAARRPTLNRSLTAGDAADAPTRD